jgi:hypothetical protein
MTDKGLSRLSRLRRFRGLIRFRGLRKFRGFRRFRGLRSKEIKTLRPFYFLSRLPKFSLPKKPYSVYED